MAQATSTRPEERPAPDVAEQRAEGASLNQLGIEAADGPDFSTLAEADRGPRTESDGA